MSRTYNEQAIALGGVFQAAALVDQIAKRGLIPQNSFEASINSIFITDPKVTEDVFGGVREVPYSLNMGLKNLVELAEKREQSKDVTRYALSMLHLESRLSKHPEMLNELSQGLDKIRDQARYFEETANGDLNSEAICWWQQLLPPQRHCSHCSPLSGHHQYF